MCLAVPAEVTSIGDGFLAEVSIMGATRSVSIDLVPSVQVGDYVLVHAGFAIEIVDAEYARETLDLIEQMAFLLDDDFEQASSPEVVAARKAGDAQ